MRLERPRDEIMEIEGKWNNEKGLKRDWKSVKIDMSIGEAR